MIRMDAMLPPEAKMLLQVHDEILVSAPRELADDIAAIMYDAMTGPGTQKLLKVPLKIDLHIGETWGQIK